MAKGKTPGTIIPNYTSDDIAKFKNIVKHLVVPEIITQIINGLSTEELTKFSMILERGGSYNLDGEDGNIFSLKYSSEENPDKHLGSFDHQEFHEIIKKDMEFKIIHANCNTLFSILFTFAKQQKFTNEKIQKILVSLHHAAILSGNWDLFQKFHDNGLQNIISEALPAIRRASAFDTFNLATGIENLIGALSEDTTENKLSKLANAQPVFSELIRITGDEITHLQQQRRQEIEHYLVDMDKALSRAKIACAVVGLASAGATLGVSATLGVMYSTTNVGIHASLLNSFSQLGPTMNYLPLMMIVTSIILAAATYYGTKGYLAPNLDTADRLREEIAVLNEFDRTLNQAKVTTSELYNTYKPTKTAQREIPELSVSVEIPDGVARQATRPTSELRK